MMTDKELIRELEISKLQEENEELKSILKGTTHCFDEEEHKRLEKENEELKKELEECQLQNFDLREDIMIQKQAFPNKQIKDKSFYDLYNMPTYKDLLTQQKEFIKYLENESKEVYRDGGLRQSIFRQILQKYKEITGDDK